MLRHISTKSNIISRFGWSFCSHPSQNLSPIPGPVTASVRAPMHPSGIPTLTVLPTTDALFL